MGRKVRRIAGFVLAAVLLVTVIVWAISYARPAAVTWSLRREWAAPPDPGSGDGWPGKRGPFEEVVQLIAARGVLELADNRKWFPCGPDPDGRVRYRADPSFFPAGPGVARLRWMPWNQTYVYRTPFDGGDAGESSVPRGLFHWSGGVKGSNIYNPATGQLDEVATYETRYGSVPVWPAAAATGCLLLATITPDLVGRRQRRDGRCRRCGYDLRASPGRCPECGAAAVA